MLRRKKVSPAVATPNPNNRCSLQQKHVVRRQEMQHDLESCYSDDQYSDIGYPSLPRPKTILSLSRASLPWNIHPASKLCTLPARVKRDRRAELEKQLQSVCVKAALSQVKVNRADPELPLNGISEGCPDTGEVSGSIRHQIRSNSISIGGEKPAEMNNHSRVKAKKGQGTAAACGEDGSQQKSKKSRKPLKALTFSFGSGSDLKRRTLGFLGKGEKKTMERPSPVTPNSPILVSKKLPGSRAVDSKEVVHPQNNGSAHTFYGSYQDVHTVRSPSWGKKRPPPLSNLSSSLGQQQQQQQLYHGKEEKSPQAKYSPPSTSGMSSRHESSESLPFSAKSETSLSAGTVSNPSSRRQSPNSVRSSSQQHGTLGEQTSTNSAAGTALTSGGRKLSDPMLLPAPSAGDSFKPSPRLHRSTLKKRNTFCVRSSSRLNANTEQDWVSGCKG